MLWRACARVFVRARGGLTELNDLLYLNRRRGEDDLELLLLVLFSYDMLFCSIRRFLYKKLMLCMCLLRCL